MLVADKTGGAIKCVRPDGYVHETRYFNDTLLIAMELIKKNCVRQVVKFGDGNY